MELIYESIHNMSKNLYDIYIYNVLINLSTAYVFFKQNLFSYICKIMKLF